MLTRRRLVQHVTTAGLVPVVLTFPFGRNAVVAQLTPDASDETPAVLDGTQPIDRDGLVAIARDRIALGVNWLEQMLRPVGTFYYIYDPTQDIVEDQEYN